MSGMCDARCPKYRKRFGWRGRVVDRPPCPRCGHQLAREILERDQATIERALTAHKRPLPCGHTEADLCESTYIAGVAVTIWCGACAAAKAKEARR